MTLAQTRVCAYNECGKPFEAKTHNQKFCNPDCCRLATNAEIMRRYYENKRRLSGEERRCSTDECNTILSRYNEEQTCQGCRSQLNRESRDNVWRRFVNGPLTA